MTNDLPTLYARVLAVVGKVPNMSYDYDQKKWQLDDVTGCDSDGVGWIYISDAVREALLCAALEAWLKAQGARHLVVALAYDGWYFTKIVQVRPDGSKFEYESRWDYSVREKLEAWLRLAEAVKSKEMG